MKIISFAELLEQPVGAVFSELRKNSTMFNDLMQFYGPNGDNDFTYADLFGAGIVDAGFTSDTMELSDALADGVKGTTFESDVESTTRWALYDTTQMFILYEKRDLQKLVGALAAAYKITPT